MTWWMWAIVILIVLGMFGNNKEQASKKEAEEEALKRRKDAEDYIMNSGDLEAIKMLKLAQANPTNYTQSLSKGMNGLGVPSKAYFSLAADKPLLVISDFGSEIGRLVEENDLGWWCKPSDPYALSIIIDYICSLDLTSYTGRPRSVFIEKYSDIIALEKYSSIVNKLNND